MFDMACIYAAASIAEARLIQYENESILNLPVECQAQARRDLEARREKFRLERREKEMHDQLCASIEKAGKNARPRQKHELW